MAIKTVEQLKAYFRKGLYPTESQFADMLDSYRHRGEKMDLTQVEGLAEALNGKCDTGEAKIIEQCLARHDGDIDWLKTKQEQQGEDIDELQASDEAQQGEIETLSGKLAKIQELIKRGAPLDQALDALAALGDDYKDLWTLASTTKRLREKELKDYLKVKDAEELYLKPTVLPTTDGVQIGHMGEEQITIEAATDSKAGVMSTEDKRILDEIPDQINRSVSGLGFDDSNSNKLLLDYDELINGEKVSKTITMNAANDESAGVMSAAMARKLNGVAASATSDSELTEDEVDAILNS